MLNLVLCFFKVVLVLKPWHLVIYLWRVDANVDLCTIGFLTLNSLNVHNIFLSVALHYFANLLTFVVTPCYLKQNKTYTRKVGSANFETCWFQYRGKVHLILIHVWSCHVSCMTHWLQEWSITDTPSDTMHNRKHTDISESLIRPYSRHQSEMRNYPSKCSLNKKLTFKHKTTCIYPLGITGFKYVLIWPLHVTMN